MKLFIGTEEIDLKEQAPIAQTKQVNNIVSLSTRQSNYTNTISVPKTAKNIRTLRFLGVPGNTSHVPYIKQEANLLDEESGDWNIYKGWATVTETNKDFKIFIYDGLIDFYKQIENKTLTQIGVPDLNHIKNLATVIDSWNNNLEFMYIIADYNGNNSTELVEVIGNFNIDYQIPSARVSYIWRRIHEYAGFTYSGNIFNTQAFINLFMSYPKPVPVETPIVTYITDQVSQILVTPTSFPSTSGGTQYGETYVPIIFPANFNNAQANNDNNYILITQDGSYRLKGTGYFTGPIYGDNGIINYILRSSTGILKASGLVDFRIGEEAIIQANIGDTLSVFAQATGSSGPTGYFPLAGSVHTYFDLILGYDANFEAALVDFGAKDFYDEIVQMFGLTSIKDKYSNNIEYLTLDEIIQNPNILNWSKKSPIITNEKYKIGSYAQKNNFKYRYNDENDTYNNGSILINNENLLDETTVINSKFYSPEKKQKIIFIETGDLITTNVYKIWNKEVKDDGTVEYKDLSGRFYLMRNKLEVLPVPATIASKVLNTTQVINSLQRESYYRLDLQSIIFDNYASIGTMLNDAKICDCEVYLKSQDLEDCDFRRMVYIEQEAAYYIVNKIGNYIKHKKTKCELIKVDYFSANDYEAITEGTYIAIASVVLDGCNVVLTLTTDQPLPAWIRIVAIRNTFGSTPDPLTDVFDQMFYITTNTVTFTLPTGGFWEFRVFLNDFIFSLPQTLDNILICTVTPPDPDFTTLTITSVHTESIVGNTRQVRINFTTDLVLPNDILITAQRSYPFGTVPTYSTQSPTAYFMLINLEHVGPGFFGDAYVQWNITLSRLGITSNTVTSDI